MQANIIFIVSSERSGSNLLRKMLTNHSRICGPKAPHLLKTFQQGSPCQEAFPNKTSRQTVFELMKSVVNCRLHDWQFPLDFVAFETNYRPISLLDFFNGFYHSTQTANKADWIVCKENNLWEFVAELHRRYRHTARWIYLSRDPRDVVSSWMNVPFGPATARHAARMWNEEQIHCLKLIEQYEHQFTQVHYEKLIQHPEAEMDRILGFLGLTVEPSCVHPERTHWGEPTTRNVYWKNLDQPVLHNNFGKYRKQLDAATQYVVSREVASTAHRLGYRVRPRNLFLQVYHWMRYLLQFRQAQSDVCKVEIEDSYTSTLFDERTRWGEKVQRELATLAKSSVSLPTVRETAVNGK